MRLAGVAAECMIRSQCNSNNLQKHTEDDLPILAPASLADAMVAGQRWRQVSDQGNLP
jgi:hypothetical protein